MFDALLKTGHGNNAMREPGQGGKTGTRPAHNRHRMQPTTQVLLLSFFLFFFLYKWLIALHDPRPLRSDLATFSDDYFLFLMKFSIFYPHRR